MTPPRLVVANAPAAHKAAPRAADRHTSTSAHPAPAPDDDVFLILDASAPVLAPVLTAFAAAGLETRAATAAEVVAAIGVGGFCTVVMTGDALRRLDLEALLAAILVQPVWFDTMVLTVDCDAPGLANRLERLHAVATVVPARKPHVVDAAVDLGRAALRMRRRHRQSRLHIESCERAEAAATALATRFEARVAERTAELATALDSCSIAGRQLTTSDERNRATIELSELMVFSASASGTLTSIDERFYALTGVDRNAAISVFSDKDRVHPDDRDRVRAAQLVAMKSGERLDYEYRGPVADGSYRWWHLRAALARNSEGSISHWYGTILDVTDRKIAEEKLRESEVLHRYSMALGSTVVWTATAEGLLDSMGDLFFQRTGLAPERICNRSWSKDLIHPDDLGVLQPAGSDVDGKRQPTDYEFRIRNADGSYLWWRIRAAPDYGPDGSLRKWYGTLEDIDELKVAEGRLRASEKLHRYSMALGSTVVWTSEPSGLLSYVGDLFYQRTGLAPEDVLHKHWDDSWVHPEDFPLVEADRVAASIEKRAGDVLLRVRNADGSYMWWRLRAAPDLAADGSIRMWYGTLEDIDELRRAEARLRASEKLHRYSMALGSTVVWTAYPAGPVNYIGDQFFQRTGLAPSDVLDKQWTEGQIHPDDYDRVVAARTAAITGKCPADYSYRIRNADGSYLWWRQRAAPELAADGAVVMWYGTLEDIDELRRAEESLRTSEALHRYSLALGSTVVFTGTPDAKMDFVGELFFRLTGLSPSDVYHRRWDEQLVHPDDLARNLPGRNAALAAGEPTEYELRIRHADGAYQWWRVRAAPDFHADGTIKLWYGTLENIDKLKRAEEALRASEKMHRFSMALGSTVVWRSEPSGLLAYVGDLFYRCTGLVPEDVLHKVWDDSWIHPEDFPVIEAERIASTAENRPADCQLRIRHADGSYLWWRLRVAPDLAADGSVRMWYGTLEEIDKLKRAEEALRESELRHRASIQLSHLITFTADDDGQLTSIDDRICEITGHSMADVMAAGTAGLCHPDDLPEFVRQVDEALETLSLDIRIRMRTAHESYRWWRIRAAPRLDDEGGITGWFGTMEDVDALVTATERLRASEELHRQSIELSDEVVWMATPDGTILDVGDRLFERLGFARADWLAMTPAERIHPDDVGWVLAGHRKATKAGLPTDKRYRLRCADGSYQWWRVRTAPRLVARRRVDRWYGMMENVDELVRAEELLRESENRHRFCIGLSNLITYTTSPTGDFESIDPEITAATGVAVSDILSDSAIKFCHPNDLEELARLREEAFTHSFAFDHVHRIRAAGGGYRWWRSRARPLLDDAGNILRWYGTFEDVDDLYRSEAKLRESEELHRFSLQLSDMVVCSAGTDGVVTDVGDRLFEIAGVTREQMFSGKVSDYLHPDDVNQMVARRRQSMRAGTSADFDFRMRKADGSYHWWRWRSAPRRDADGKVVRWYGTLENIDSLRRAEALLRASEELHRRSLELSNLIVWTGTADGNFRSIDPRIFNELGLSPEAAAARRPFDFLHPKDFSAAVDAFKAGMKHGAPADFRLRLRQANGSYRWWRLRASPDRADDGSILRWYGTLEDIHELKRAEERLRDSDELHRFSVELSNLVVWTGSPEGQVLSVGPRLFEKLGTDMRSLAAENPRHRIHPDDYAHIQALRKHTLETGEPLDTQYRLLHADGSYHWWRLRAAPLRRTDGRIRRWYGTLEDIDDLKRAEELLRESEEIYRNTVELSNQIVMTATPLGTFVKVGDNWQSMTGFDFDPTNGSALSMHLYHPECAERIRKERINAFRTGRPLDQTYRMVRPDGSYRWWRLRAAPRPDADGRLWTWYGTLEDVNELQLAEARLRESEEAYRNTVELSNQVVVTTTALGEPMMIGDNWEALTGFSIEAMQGSALIGSLCHPDDVEGAIRQRIESYRTGAPLDQTFRILRPDGGYRWWRLRGAPRWDAAAQWYIWYGTLEDVNELKVAETRLLASEELYRNTVQLSNQIVITSTPLGRVLTMGGNWDSMTGKPAGEISGSILKAGMCHPDDIEWVQKERIDAYRTGTPIDQLYRMITPQGGYRWWRARGAPQYNAESRGYIWYGTLEDVDALKRAEAARQEADAVFRHIIELSGQLPWMATADGLEISLDAFGADAPPDLDRFDIADFNDAHPDDLAHINASRAAAIAASGPIDIRYRVRSLSGDYRWWRSRGAPRRDSKGRIFRWYGTLENIDAAMRAEVQLQQMQSEMMHLSRLKAMGTMASTLAHELNQPLAAVVNYIGGSRRLLGEPQTDEAVRIAEAMRSAEDCAMRAGKIIRKVRDQVSRHDTRQADEDVAKLVEEACSIALINARSLGIDVTYEFDPDAQTIHVDAVQAQQIFINFLRNAVDAVSGTADRRLLVQTRRDGAFCAISVCDSGPGIAPDMAERLFEPFASGKPDGVGIGLSICRTIAESHGGRIEHGSSSLGGACFTVKLPLGAA